MMPLRFDGLAYVSINVPNAVVNFFLCMILYTELPYLIVDSRPGRWLEWSVPCCAGLR